MCKKHLQQKGFTLIETLIYVACFTLILVALTDITLSVNKIYAHVRTLNTLQTSAITSLQNISRDVKVASQIQSISTNPAHFVLTAKDAQENVLTQEYYLENGVLYVKKNNSQVVALTDSSVQVSDFEAYPVLAGSSTALTTKLSLQVFNSGATTTENFQLTDLMMGK